ncbi:MAG: glycosyltransferase family 2 protein [Clostridiales bacterium]|nr:glycosyltransferase family 2 protein [Clostridiales bacterium]
MSLSLCMIVKNEADVLGRALSDASVYADEIIIVDTGSTDGTKDVAREFTDKIYDFEWRDDFAAARNFAFSKATGDYCMWLDADDVVPITSARAIARLMKHIGDADVVMLPYVISEDGPRSYSYYRERIVRNRPDYLFVGRVHEAIALSGNVVYKSVPVYHRKPSRKSDSTRNLDIYKRMLAENAAFSPRDRYYYARELYFNDETVAAARELERFIVEPDGFYVNKIDACLILSRCYRKNGDRQAAYLALFDSFLFGLPTGEVACEIALMYFADEKYALAAYWFERAATAKPDVKSGAFVDTEYYAFFPLVWLSVCYDKLGKTRTAYRYHCRARKLRPDHPSVIANDRYFQSLGYL